MWLYCYLDHLPNRLFDLPMKELTFNQWQEHLAKELQENYRKLKLIKNEKLQTISPAEPASVQRIQNSRIPVNQ